MEPKIMETIAAVRKTLDDIRVSGRTDCEKMLACMMALDKLLTASRAQEKEE